MGIRVSGNSAGWMNTVFSGCPMMVSYLNFSPLSEHPGEAGVSLGCWKQGLEAFLSCGLLFRVWPHSGHDIYEGYSLKKGSNLGRRGVAGYSPIWKGGEGVGTRGPETFWGKKRKRINWGGVSKQSLDPVLFLRESTAA